MKPTFRKTDKGQIVFAILAQWVADRLTRSGKTLPEWAATGYKLSAIGINKRSAIAELKPRQPDAHTWYNAHGDSRTRGHCATFEDYWTVLFNRLFYFFHRHNEDGRGKLVPVVTEWPGQISQDGLSLIPPPIPYNCYPEDDGPTDDPPGTGYPEDDPPVRGIGSRLTEEGRCRVIPNVSRSSALGRGMVRFQSSLEVVLRRFAFYIIDERRKINPNRGG